MFGEQYFENKDLYEFILVPIYWALCRDFDPIDMMYYFYDDWTFYEG